MAEAGVMIEVERKFRVESIESTTAAVEGAGGSLTSRSSFTDVYYDTESLTLAQ